MVAIDQYDLITDLLYHHWTLSVFIRIVIDSLTFCTTGGVSSFLLLSLSNGAE